MKTASRQVSGYAGELMRPDDQLANMGCGGIPGIKEA